MAFKVESEFESRDWSGGSTRELFIFPICSSYAERNFQFRLSNASLESEASQFTSLPGVSRKLLLLDGSLQLKYENEKPATLIKGECIAFDGGKDMRSMGRGEDINVMTTGAFESHVEYFRLSIRKMIIFDFGEDFFSAIYVHRGEIKLQYGNQFFSVREKNLGYCLPASAEEMKMEGIAPESEYVVVRINIGNSKVAG